MLYIGYAFILLVCLGVTLVCFDKIKPKVYPFLLYGIGAGMVLMTSLAGPYLVGHDIHLEYYYALLRAGRNVLQPIIGSPQGTFILTYLTDNIWVYKVVYPVLFALIPPILYFIFRKWFTSKQSFLAGFFFIAFPAFFMELPSLARQMTAELVLVVLLYLLVVSNLRIRYKIPLIVVCAGLLPLLHYATAIVALILLGIGCLLGKRKKLIGILLGVIVVVSTIYFPLAEKGIVAIKLEYLYNSWVPAALHISVPPYSMLPSPRPEVEEYYPSVGNQTNVPFLERYETLIRSGLGLDFLQTTVLGKIFRILDWILIILIGVGIWKLRRNKEYWLFASGGIILIMFLLIPGFSNLLNVTRFLHLSLFLLAPILTVALKPGYLLIILIPYFLFTSGFIFEVAKVPNIENPTIPYNIGLSDYRMDLGATVTKDDIEVRDYIYKNNLFPIYSDINGANLIGEVVGWRNDLDAALGRTSFNLTNAYVFVRSRNIQDGTFTAWGGVGLRKYVDPLEYYGINMSENIIYQSGEARVLWIP